MYTKHTPQDINVYHILFGNWDTGCPTDNIGVQLGCPDCFWVVSDNQKGLNSLPAYTCSIYQYCM